jgi:hypothetical protein
MYFRYCLLFVFLLLGTVCCQKEDPTPSTATLATNGSLPGLWSEKEKRAREYTTTGQLLRDDTYMIEQPYRYELLIDATTLRERSYAGATLTYDSVYTYTRREQTLVVMDQPIRELKILELTDRKLTVEYKVIKPAGRYTIEEDRYVR